MSGPEEKDIAELIDAVRASARSPAENVALILRKKKSKETRRGRPKAPKAPLQEPAGETS